VEAPILAAPKKGAVRAGATVVFVEESGFSQRPSVRRIWAPRGQTPVLREHFNWKRLAASGAIAWRPDQPRTRLFLSLRPGAIASEQVVAFLRQLRRHVRGKVVLLWDGLPAHRSGQTQAYVEANRSGLTVERLPAYAPELNPVEDLWASLTSRATANFSPDTLEELGGRLRSGIRCLRRQPDLGLNFIKHASLISEQERLQLCESQ